MSRNHIFQTIQMTEHTYKCTQLKLSLSFWIWYSTTLHSHTCFFTNKCQKLCLFMEVHHVPVSVTNTKDVSFSSIFLCTFFNWGECAKMSYSDWVFYCSTTTKIAVFGKSQIVDKCKMSVRLISVMKLQIYLQTIYVCVKPK